LVKGGSFLSLFIFFLRTKSLENSVGTANGYWLDDPCSIPCHTRFLSPPQRPGRLYGHPIFYPMGTWGSFSGVKRLVCVADNSPPTSAKVKNGGAIASLPHVPSWLSAELIKHRGNFTFIRFHVFSLIFPSSFFPCFCYCSCRVRPVRKAANFIAISEPIV
jgi:hypothetical protein